MSTAFAIRPTTRLVRASYFFAVLLAMAILVLGLRFGLNRRTQYALQAIPAILLLVTLWRHFSRRFVKLTVADGRLRFQSGILNRTIRTLELSRIQDVRADQRLSQRLMGIGDITIETAGEAGSLALKDVDSPQRVAERILDMARSDNRPAT